MTCLNRKIEMNAKKKRRTYQKEDEQIPKQPAGVLFIEWIMMLLLPAAAFYLMEAYEHNAFAEVRQLAQWYNILLMELIAWIFFILTSSARTALRIQWGVCMLFGLVNHYVMLFRSTPFVPWDLFSVRTAASVADNYDFTPDNRVILVTLAFVVVLVLLHFQKLRLTLPLYLRIIPTVIVGLAMGLFVDALQDEDFQTSHYLYPYLFTPVYMTKVNGMAVTFAMDLAYIVVEKPEGYSSSDAAKLYAEYEEAAAENSSTQQELPNIIVIMDEAFSDLGVLGEFETNVDTMPFVHSLQQGAENTITGYLNVSVCGGNTANTEYEFLTGNTMAFLPSGSIPYQQYITGEIPGLVSHLRSLGYDTYAVHPYNSTGWDRDKVYPWMGFDTSLFIRNFSGVKLVRNYVSDASDFDKIKEIMEQKEAGVPAFIFNVTMQNHSSYTDAYENFAPDVTVSGIDDFALSQYLSLIRLTDQELQKLIQYFSDWEEDTIVVFFGDHQPADSVVRGILRLNGMEVQNLSQEELELRYQVPYVIWANYDIGEVSGEDTSVNYLAAHVLQAAGVPLSGYQTFLMKLEEAYPVLSAIRTESYEDSIGSEDLLAEYRRLQYYLMFDWKGTGE